MCDLFIRCVFLRSVVINVVPSRFVLRCFFLRGLFRRCVLFDGFSSMFVLRVVVFDVFSSTFVFDVF